MLPISSDRILGQSDSRLGEDGFPLAQEAYRLKPFKLQERVTDVAM